MIFSCLEKRDLLNQPAASVDSLVSWGEQLEQEGLVHDAVDFYQKASFASGLERLLELSVQEGDAFLFTRICRALQREGTREQWAALGARAEALGKTAFAAEANRKAGLEKQA